MHHRDRPEDFDPQNLFTMQAFIIIQNPGNLLTVASQDCVNHLNRAASSAQEQDPFTHFSEVNILGQFHQVFISSGAVLYKIHNIGHLNHADRGNRLDIEAVLFGHDDRFLGPFPLRLGHFSFGLYFFYLYLVFYRAVVFLGDYREGRTDSDLPPHLHQMKKIPVGIGSDILNRLGRFDLSNLLALPDKFAFILKPYRQSNLLLVGGKHGDLLHDILHKSISSMASSIAFSSGSILFSRCFAAGMTESWA